MAAFSLPYGDRFIATAIHVIYLWRHPNRRVKSKRRVKEPSLLMRNAVARDKKVELIRTDISKEPGTT